MTKEELIHIISKNSDRYGNLLIKCMEQYNVTNLQELKTENLEEFIKEQKLYEKEN